MQQERGFENAEEVAIKMADEVKYLNFRIELRNDKSSGLKEAELDIKDYFELFKLYYMNDAASYTSLRGLFSIEERFDELF